MADPAGSELSSDDELMPDGTFRHRLEIPDALALLPVRDLVVFPYMVVPLMVSGNQTYCDIDRFPEFQRSPA